MKSIYLVAFCMLTILSCSTNDDSENNINPIDSGSAFGLENITKITTAPLTNAREAITYNNELYTVDNTSTYKYSFSTNNWNGLTTQNNAENIDIAKNPIEGYNLSFIKDDKWYVLNSNTLSSYDLKELKWTILKQFDQEETIANPDGFYENETLYVYSDNENTMFTYNFEENVFVEYSNYDVHSSYGQLVNSFFKINNEYYFVKLSDYRTISIYKLSSDYSELILLNDFVGNKNMIKGNGFVYENSIIFGLGGDTYLDGNDTKYLLNETFYQYDITNNEIKLINNNILNGRYASLPISNDNKLYIFGGSAFQGEEQFDFNTLDQMDFGMVIE